MTEKRSHISLIIVILTSLMAAITLPGFFNYYYRAGTGHAFREIVISKNLSWDRMTQSECEPHEKCASAAGLKCAVLMTLGQHIPFYLFILITVGLFSSSISRGFRLFLRFSFFAVWGLGVCFLSLGSECCGLAIPFPESLGPASLIFLAEVAIFGIILAIGKLCHRNIAR